LDIAETDVDGWLVGQNLERIQGAGETAQLKEMARRIAVSAILRKATLLVGPIKPATKHVVETLEEPYRGEIDVDLTLENIIGKEYPDKQDWIVRRREARRIQLVLMLDTSLSMGGKNLALAAVAGAVLAMKVPAADLSVVAFESSARTLSHLHSPDSVDDVVDSIIRKPATGYTNIEAALRQGRRELQKGLLRRKAGLLITDGVYTAGGDPTIEAVRFPRLHVLLTEDYKMDEDLCRRLARLGRGTLFRVNGYEELPRRMLDITNRLLR
jgi:Mg-chelatase subunit ChlD